jgi:hypothetical protein
MTYSQTALGFKYPQSNEHTRMWEHFQQLADSIQLLWDDKPYAVLTKSDNQALPNISQTALTYDGAYGEAGCIDLTNDRLLVNKAGLWQVTAGFGWAAVGGYRTALIRWHNTVAGTEDIIGSYYDATTHNTSTTVYVQCVARKVLAVPGDYFYTQASQASGAASTTSSANAAQYLQGCWERPA